MDSPFGIALKKIEARITKSDEEGLRARWESGRKLLSQREGKLLPRGLLEAVATELGVSRQELQFRVKFVEIYPTEQELSNGVRQFGSWHQIAAKFVEMYPTEDELRNAITQFGSWYQIVVPIPREVR